MTHRESTKDYHYVQRESRTQARGTVNVPQSTAASAAGVHVVDSLVQHIQREKEPVFVCGAARETPRRKRGAIFVFVWRVVT